MTRVVTHITLLSMLLTSTAALAQDDVDDDVDEAQGDDEDGEGGHPTAGRFSFAARGGWTSRMGSTPQVDPLQIYPAEDDPFAVDGPLTPADVENGLRTAGKRLPDTNPFGLRLGARGGYTLADDLLYFGAAAHYYLGDEEAASYVDSNGGPVSATTKANLLTLGLELGVDAYLGAGLVMRPFFGFGAAVGLSEVCVQGACESGTQLQAYYNPGLGLVGFVTDDIFVGGELQLIGVTGPGRVSGFDAQLTGGLAL